MKLQVSIAMLASLVLAACWTTQTQAQEFATFERQDFSRVGTASNWYPYVIARGADRVAIQSTPMACRPYRPMHFYGNAVRRSYFRGSPALMPSVVRGAAVLLRR